MIYHLQTYKKSYIIRPVFFSHCSANSCSSPRNYKRVRIHNNRQLVLSLQDLKVRVDGNSHRICNLLNNEAGHGASENDSRVSTVIIGSGTRQRTGQTRRKRQQPSYCWIACSTTGTSGRSHGVFRPIRGPKHSKISSWTSR